MFRWSPSRYTAALVSALPSSRARVWASTSVALARAAARRACGGRIGGRIGGEWSARRKNMPWPAYEVLPMKQHHLPITRQSLTAAASRSFLTATSRRAAAAAASPASNSASSCRARDLAAICCLRAASTSLRVKGVGGVGVAWPSWASQVPVAWPSAVHLVPLCPNHHNDKSNPSRSHPPATHDSSFALAARSRATRSRSRRTTASLWALARFSSSAALPSTARVCLAAMAANRRSRSAFSSA